MSIVFNPHDLRKMTKNRALMAATWATIPSPLRDQRTEEEEREGLSIDDLLLKERIIFIGGVIDDGTAFRVITSLLYLQSRDADREVQIYINSPGGSVSAGLAIYDTIQYIKPPISTVCVGKAMSMASFLLAAGAKGNRCCLPNATIMLHQPLILDVIEGMASDLEIEANAIVRLRTSLYEIIAKHTGQLIERIALDLDRDNYLTAQQAVAYGLIDEVLPYS